MVFQKETLLYVLILTITVVGFEENPKDQTSTRANTLFDDADDIQRQLNNEAHDKLLMYGKPKTIWVLHFPTESPHGNTISLTRHSRNSKLFQQTKTTRAKKLDVKKKYNLIKQVKHWSYKDQSNWHKQYPACGGHSQSPVDLPAVGLIKTKGCRQLTFLNYDAEPKSLMLKNNAKRLILYGEWECERQPVVYGGAAHSRRYLFHSLTLRWPSEHRIGGLQYPLESQVIHISAEYKSLNNAINATPRDAQAILGIVNLYKAMHGQLEAVRMNCFKLRLHSELHPTYTWNCSSSCDCFRRLAAVINGSFKLLTYSNETHQGLEELIHVATHSRNIDACLRPKPLAYFNPPLKEYVGYQGSLTMPPCSENVLWLVRARALSVTREMVDVVFNFIGEGELRGSFIRQPQPLNDRKVYLFD